MRGKGERRCVCAIHAKRQKREVHLVYVAPCKIGSLAHNGPRSVLYGRDDDRLVSLGVFQVCGELEAGGKLNRREREKDWEGVAVQLA